MREEIAYREMKDEVQTKMAESQDFHDPSMRPEAHRAAERDAHRTPGADRMPTPEEERLAEQQKVPPGTAEHYEEMARIGADQKGEGRID